LGLDASISRCPAAEGIFVAEFPSIKEAAWYESRGLGELNGYLVHIAEQGGQCYLWLMPGSQWTEWCLRVGSLSEGAKLARAWIEKRKKT
jgi:hypothetical protein